MMACAYSSREREAVCSRFGLAASPARPTGRVVWISVFAWTASIVLLAAQTAQALINPHFTPRDLVRGAEQILVLRVADDKTARVELKAVRAVKGKASQEPLLLDLTAVAAQAHARALTAQLRALGERNLVLVVGKGEKGESVALLHVTTPGELGKWYSVAAAADGTWSLLGFNSPMQAVWSGGTDMLIRIADLLVKHPDSTVPCVAGVSWIDGDVKIGTVAGKVTGAQAVDLVGDGKLSLYVGSAEGDRLFHYDAVAKQFEDVTAERRLGAASRASAWCDFNADGRADLASSSGDGLAVWQQQSDGTFEPRDLTPVPDGECLGLHVLKGVSWPAPGLVWTGRDGPILLRPRAGGALAPAKVFDAAGTDLAALGVPYACVVADFDADSRPDVLWPFEKGSLFFRGGEEGTFESGAAVEVRVGGRRGGCFIGDFDADGLFDLFAVSESSCMIWQNRGDARFEETMIQSGEVEHVYSGAGVGGSTCDFNNDGLQDVLVLYADHAPHLFFNRGFRSFGHAHMLDLTEAQRLLPAHAGQQAGVIADLDHDAAQDMALVLRGGDVYVTPRNWDEDPLALRVAVPAGKGWPAPLRLTAWDERRCLGAWNLVAGSSEAFLGVLEPGIEITLKWRLPGGREQSKKVLIEDRPVRLVLPPPP
jgi:hypothetical protein